MGTNLYKKNLLLVAGIAVLILFSACVRREVITDLEQLSDKVFAVPTGTMADDLVLSRFPDASFQYYNNVIDAAMAAKAGRVDAAAYDEPILRNIAAKHHDLKVLPEMITYDSYGFAFRMEDENLKEAFDSLLKSMKDDGSYDDLLRRWLPDVGSPAPMPAIKTPEERGVLVLGTAAVTEPFSYVDDSRNVVGLDIELAMLMARQLGMRLEIVDMDFGALIPSLSSGRVDMIGALITISEERAKQVLFSEPYYIGGIAAIVKVE